MAKTDTTISDKASKEFSRIVDAIAEFLMKSKAGWSVVDRLIDKGVLVEREFQGEKFFASKLFAVRNNEMLRSRME